MMRTVLNIRSLAFVAMAAMYGSSAHAQIGSNKTASPAIPQQSISALTPQASAAAIESCNGKMQPLLAALDKGDYAGAETDFDDSMKAGLTPDQLKQAWLSLPVKFGQPVSRGAPHNSMSGGYVVITMPMTYQNGNLAAQIACSAVGKIAGFHVLLWPAPASASTSTAPAASAATPASAATGGH